MECSRQVFDELSEVYPFVGNVIEDSLVAIALIFHVADFHLQSQVFGNLPALNHGSMLSAFRLVVFIHVHLLGQSVHAFDIVGRFNVGLFQLQFHQSSSERNHAYVVPRTCLHGHDVAFFQVEVVHIVVITLSGVFKLHFHQVCRLIVSRHICQVVVGVQLLILPSATANGESTVGIASDAEFHVLIVHLL